MNLEEELSYLRNKVVELEMEAKVSKSMLRDEILTRKQNQEELEAITHEALIEIGFSPDYGDQSAMIGAESEAVEYELKLTDHISINFFPTFGQMWMLKEWVGSEMYSTEIQGPSNTKELEILVQCLCHDEKEKST